MTLREAEVGVEYIVKNIQTDDEELDAVAGVFESMLDDVDFEH